MKAARIEDEGGLRNAVFRTLGAGSNIWARCKYQDDPKNSYLSYPLPVPDLRSYYMESPLFRLFVSERSRLKDGLDEPFEAGVFDAVTGGYFLLLKSLEPGAYRIRFGGKGKGSYLTDSIYDITVSKAQRQSIREAWEGKQSDVPKKDGFGI